MTDLDGLPVDFGATSCSDSSSPNCALDRSLPLVSQTALVLMLAVPVSSSSTRPEEHWAHVFTQFSTTHSAFVEPAPTRTARAHRVMPLTAEQLATVQTFFGLSKTQLAQVCRVQRQTIYDWYAGRFEAVGKNARRLACLHGIAERHRVGAGRALPSRVASRSLSSGGTLLELLSVEDIDAGAVGAIVAQLDEATMSGRSRGAAAARARLGWAPPSPRSAEETLESNLDDFVDG